MLIYLLFFIPFVSAAVLWLLWGQRTAWWEMLILIVVSTVLIVVAKLLVELGYVSDTEYWTNKVAKAEYYEEWTEEWYETVYDRDADGNITGSHIERRTSYHWPEYYLILSPSGQISVNQTKYKEMVRRFGNETEKDLFHFGQCSWGDGDMFYTVFEGERDDTVVATTTHRYENRVQAAKSVFNFPQVTEQDKKNYHLFDYPKINDCTTVPSILGNGGLTQTKANRELCILNAELGPRPNHQQIRMWLLVWQDQPVDAALMQESYWFGGNKNELVVCIGINQQYNVKWAYVFSWSEAEELKVKIRNFIRKQKQLDLNEIVDYMGQEVKDKWVRKQFKDFSYLTVEPPMSSILTVGAIILIINVGLCVWIVMNEINAD